MGSTTGDDDGDNTTAFVGPVTSSTTATLDASALPSSAPPGIGGRREIKECALTNPSSQGKKKEKNRKNDRNASDTDRNTFQEDTPMMAVDSSSLTSNNGNNATNENDAVDALMDLSPKKVTETRQPQEAGHVANYLRTPANLALFETMKGDAIAEWNKGGQTVPVPDAIADTMDYIITNMTSNLDLNPSPKCFMCSKEHFIDECRIVNDDEMLKNIVTRTRALIAVITKQTQDSEAKVNSVTNDPSTPGNGIISTGSKVDDDRRQQQETEDKDSLVQQADQEQGGAGSTLRDDRPSRRPSKAVPSFDNVESRQEDVVEAGQSLPSAQNETNLETPNLSTDEESPTKVGDETGQDSSAEVGKARDKVLAEQPPPIQNEENRSTSTKGGVAAPTSSVSENRQSLANTMTTTSRKRKARQPDFDGIDDLPTLIGRHKKYRGDPDPADETEEFDDDSKAPLVSRGGRRLKKKQMEIEPAVEPTPRGRGRRGCPPGGWSKRPKQSKPQKQSKPRGRPKSSTKRRTVPRSTSAYSEYLMKNEQADDPNPHYVEEDAWKYHNPPLGGVVGQDDLKPLPQALPLPTEFPRAGTNSNDIDTSTRWTTNDENRELNVVFSGEVVDAGDDKFLVSMMERDDLAVLCSGVLCEGLEPSLWNLSEIAVSLGNEEFHHNFHLYAPENQSGAVIGEACSMIMSKFAEYMHLRNARARLSGKSFEFEDGLKRPHRVDMGKESLFMKGLEMKRCLRDTYEDFVGSFGLSGRLPGGEHCMMHRVNSNGRPYMGPHLNISPPGVMTSLHQNGQGTLDSGIVCISGFLEVVMLRRLTERHKQNALAILCGGEGGVAPSLYQNDTPPKWPTTGVVEKWRQMGYCPSTLVLHPGQYLHIGKGRLYATRQVSSDKLHKEDCHFLLRRQLLKKFDVFDGACITVTWDWMFRGVSTEGINREVLALVECAELNRRNLQKSLAQPELCVVQMARNLLERNEKITKMMGFNRNNSPNTLLASSNLDEMKGILPGLRYVVMKQLETMKLAGLRTYHFKKRVIDGGKVHHQTAEEPQNENPDDAKARASESAIPSQEDDKVENHDYDMSLRRDKKPNAFQNPLKFPVDPYGVSGFSCQVCHMELSNMYLHCEGCENLLGKDFNICLRCYQEERDKTFVQMHGTDCGTLSSAHHTGNFPLKGVAKSGSCKPKEFTKCKYCFSCPCCSCTCHLRFSAHLRFFNEENEETVLRRVEQVAGMDATKCDEAFQRLHQAATGTSYEEISGKSVANDANGLDKGIPKDGNEADKGDPKDANGRDKAVPKDDSRVDKGGPKDRGGVDQGGLTDDNDQAVKEEATDLTSTILHSV